MTETPSLPAPFDALPRLQRRFGLELTHIRAAIQRSHEVRGRLESRLRGACPENCSLVLCGSLGRFEVTSGSDIDWNLLIDGPVEASHRDTANAIKAEVDKAHVEEKLEAPNATGPFAGMVFSHELVHAIGGDEDTNRKMTLRMLLLLEAHAISQPHILDRVVSNILERYLDHDRQAYKPAGERNSFPRFLMNDIVRFWRTMAVDCRSKIDTRGAREWALRNAKLRFSRKLLFVAGLLLAYEAVLTAPPQADERSPALELIARIQEITKLPPLEVLARALMRFETWPGAADCAARILNSYDAFIGIIASGTSRGELESVTQEQAAQSAVFQEVRRLSREFQGGLDAFFYHGPAEISKLTYNYSLF